MTNLVTGGKALINDTNPSAIKSYRILRPRFISIVQSGPNAAVEWASGTITLTSGELGVTNDLTILGLGSGVLAVSGNKAGWVFRIQTGNVSISDLTIANRQTGFLA